MRRENTIPRSRARLVSSLTPGAWQAWGMAIRLPAGVAQRMTRAGEYLRPVVAQRHACAAGGTPVARDGRVVFASVSKSRSCRSRS